MKHKIMFYNFLRLFIAIVLTVSALSVFSQAEFSLNDNEEHGFFIIANPIADIGEFRAEVTKYSWKNYASDKLKVSHIKIGEENDLPIMYLRPFRDRAHAMKFYNDLKSKQPNFLQMKMTNAYFAVSKSNYEEMLRKQTIKGYQTFFEQNYLNK